MFHTHTHKQQNLLNIAAVGRFHFISFICRQHSNI